MSQQLFSSLSLPAVLLCHIRIIGKGSMMVGDEVHACQIKPKAEAEIAPSRPIGKITASTFSSSRGIYHGTAIVGAPRLLEYLTWNAQSALEMKCGRLVRQANGVIAKQLAVVVRKAKVESRQHEACLSLIIR